MRVLVTGGTGFVGQEVLRQLRNAGHIARLLVRDPNSPSARKAACPPHVDLAPGDIHDPAALLRACRGSDAVIHLVGIISEIRGNTFERVHHLGSRNVVAAAIEAGCRRFLHMSALGTRPDAVSRYHQSKWLGEQEVRASGLDWTIFRPSIIHGPGDGFVNLFERMSRWSPVLPLIGGGHSRFQPIAVGDVAACFVRALAEPRAVRATFDLGGSEVLTLAQIIDTILRVTGRRRWKCPVPWSVARVQAACLEAIFPRLLGKPAPLNRDQLLMLREDNVGNPAPARELFGLGTTTFEAAIRSHLAHGS